MSNSQRVFGFSELNTCDLLVDAIYKGGESKNSGADPLSKLFKCGVSGGFRYMGSIKSMKMCALYSSMDNINWPDSLDVETGTFTYFGDNKKPGHDLHDTPKKGNQILKNIFDWLHTNQRRRIPPIFIFTKRGTEFGRDIVFRGLAVPGALGISATGDLVAEWKTSQGQRFQNYRAIFTVLNVQSIPRAWMENIEAGNPFTTNAPKEWLDWIEGNDYKPLQAPRMVKHRTRDEQLPENDSQRAIVDCIREFFGKHPKGAYAFESCAVEIAKLMDRNIVSCDLTRPWKDGGRDAVGKYRIGKESNAIHVDFALEAKFYDYSNACGVRETSRLISRLRHRQLGVFVTTSYLHSQAYEEIIEDGHPVVVISSGDIAKILIDAGYNDTNMLLSWLTINFS